MTPGPAGRPGAWLGDCFLPPVSPGDGSSLRHLRIEEHGPSGGRTSPISPPAADFSGTATPRQDKERATKMRIDAIAIGDNPPDDVNVIIEVSRDPSQLFDR